jgi:polyphosphate kinase 2 (PPK2 family)
MGFCSEAQRRKFPELCPQIERYIVDGGIILLKFWLEVGQEEQVLRTLPIGNAPRKKGTLPKRSTKGSSTMMTAF